MSEIKPSEIIMPDKNALKILPKEHELTFEAEEFGPGDPMYEALVDASKVIMLVDGWPVAEFNKTKIKND
jgi:hypothetical protein